MTVLLTGATGHVGANLLRALIERRERVRAVVRPGADRKAVLGLDVEIVEGDVRDPVAMRAAMAGCQRAYHCAAKVQTIRGGEGELFDINVLGTRNVLSAARSEGVSRVVVTSSLGAVGHPPDRPCNEEDPFDPFAPHLPYEQSKAWVEHECLRAACTGLDVVIAVSTAVLGPNDYVPSRMGRVILDFANGDLRAFIPGGFEFVSASDLAQGHLLCMDRGRSGQRYILSTAFVTIDDLMGILERVTARRRPRRLSPAIMMGIAHVSTFLLNRFDPDRPRRFTPDAVRLLQMQRRADISKARNELGYAPTSIEQAVSDAYAWFVAQGRVRKPMPPASDALPAHASRASHLPPASDAGAERAAQKTRSLSARDAVSETATQKEPS
jgi:nucleoside-diphosphate-sugar epimerase